MNAISFDNSYARLPGQFYARLNPKPVAAPSLIVMNDALAKSLNFEPDFLRSPAGLGMMSGNRMPDGAEPLAMAYAGHQFGHFVPQLGDGRANLLGEIVDKNGNRFDIQLKGAGPTPFSRNGDGRAALGPILREYIVSEAMARLDVPTTRALAAVLTGEPVIRETLLPGAILTRVASSHIRVGTFQYFLARGDHESLQSLLDHVIERHYPKSAAAKNPALSVLQEVVSRQARLIAKWMSLGFIHGVMNTDNMSIAGETIDYGPCAFLDVYEPDKHFSAVDQMGRYAYHNQSAIGQWNLSRFAQCLLPLIDPDETHAIDCAQSAIDAYSDEFERAYFASMGQKLGLQEIKEGDQALIRDILVRMAEKKVDFTLFFRRLGTYLLTGKSPADLFENPESFTEWEVKWRERLSKTKHSDNVLGKQMNSCNPAIIPRNHLVEEAIEAAVYHSDFSPFHQLVRALENPFIDQPDDARYEQPPRAEQQVFQTFCGT